MIYPNKLKSGSHIRVIVPSRSFKIVSEGTCEIAKKCFADMGISVSYSNHCDEIDDFVSSSIASRLEDLHEAFADKSVDGILTAIGGFNSNQLIDKIDYTLIKNNPKILCGFLDITCLCHAITAKTGVATYSGPHFSSFGMVHGFDYTLDYFKKCLIDNTPYQVIPTKEFSNDEWFVDQEKRNFIHNSDFWVINKGNGSEFEGKLIDGHVRYLSSLQGTEFWPSLENTILFLEEDEETNAVLFDRLLQSLIHQADFKHVKALIIGRFKPESKIDRNLIEQIIHTKEALKELPVIANFDIGHTTPIITYPIGGRISLKIRGEEAPIIEILEH